MRESVCVEKPRWRREERDVGRLREMIPGKVANQIGVGITSLLLLKGHLGPVTSLDLLQVLGEGSLLLGREGLPAELEVGEGDLGDSGGGGATALGGTDGGASKVADHFIDVRGRN